MSSSRKSNRRIFEALSMGVKLIENVYTLDSAPPIPSFFPCLSSIPFPSVPFVPIPFHFLPFSLFQLNLFPSIPIPSHQILSFPLPDLTSFYCLPFCFIRYCFLNSNTSQPSYLHILPYFTFP